MRRGAILLALLIGGCATPPGAGVGGGIVSTNPCVDSVLVRILPPARIAAISHYSQDPSATSIPIVVARRFRGIAGTAEEVIALHPDLVIASTYTPPATQAAYARAGLKMLLVGIPDSISESQAQVTQIAEAVGAPMGGARINAEIDRAVAHWSSKNGPSPSALLYISGDLATGGSTLLNDMMTRVGFRNAAATYGLTHTGTLSAETIVTEPPAVVIASERASRGTTLRRRLLPNTPQAVFPRVLINCGGPTIPPALERLAAIRAGL
ncbi:ABC transporter substrate-binding protein [Sphingomonas sp. PAMC26645]|uniref:ABC transporter substrate-binding protein n=1 Tax=Sphingomonas sp. PAMC26645 TaxID=2565555 RepID=UPI00109E1A63|nr:ABC transporter substrate-binding protein [Sphingomonas sp. PAMC26645]QCB43860.1 ABC transporter substrate-binding protein [Sphingomonas sp. PAMC26645]